MPSQYNPNYFQAILNLLQGRHSTAATVWGMFWQAVYAIAGCVIGAVVLGNWGAFIGTIIGAWLGFRAVNPYHSLVNQLGDLSDHQKQNLTDEIRRTVGSSTAEGLLRYAMNGNGRQFLFDMVQRFLTGNQPYNANPNPGLFSRIFS